VTRLPALLLTTALAAADPAGDPTPWLHWGSTTAAVLARCVLFGAGLVLLLRGVELARARAQAGDNAAPVKLDTHWGGLGGGVGGFELSRGLTELLLIVWLTGLGVGLLGLATYGGAALPDGATLTDGSTP
jgi:hypothetical protein